MGLLLHLCQQLHVHVAKDDRLTGSATNPKPNMREILMRWMAPSPGIAVP